MSLIAFSKINEKKSLVSLAISYLVGEALASPIIAKSTLKLVL